MVRGTVFETPSWARLLRELQDAIDDLRRLLDDRDPSARMLAPERHAIERALDRYEAAGDGITCYVDGVLSRTAPRPRR
jgi:ABC-type transporter Mla subunit MlaD